MYTSYGLIINELNNVTFKKTNLRVVMSFKSFAKKVFFLQIISFWSFRSWIHYDVLIDLISSSLNLMSNLTSTCQRQIFFNFYFLHNYCGVDWLALLRRPCKGLRKKSSQVFLYIHCRYVFTCTFIK